MTDLCLVQGVDTDYTIETGPSATDGFSMMESKGFYLSFVNFVILILLQLTVILLAQYANVLEIGMFVGATP